MKKLVLLSLLAFVTFVFDATARVYTVSNVATRPAQFTNLQAAVDSAGFGDTILITGGGAVYGGFQGQAITFRKPLVLIGEGINNPNQLTRINALNLGRLNSSLSASGSRFYGLEIQQNSGVNIGASFAGSQPSQTIIEDLIFERCSFIVGLNMQEGVTYSDITVRNCVFKAPNTSGWTMLGFTTSATYSNIQAINCVFSMGRITSGTALNLNGNVIIRNSVFVENPNNVFTTVRGIVLENNIFYRAEPTGCSECTFNNNLTYLCNDNALPPTAGNNVGSGNIVNVDPMFENFPQLGAAFSFAHNYGLKAGSPALGSGTNGTNIGLTGGSAPVNNIPQFPKIPAVTEIDIPVSSVPVGGTLQINLRAITRD